MQTIHKGVDQFFTVAPQISKSYDSATFKHLNNYVLVMYKSTKLSLHICHIYNIYDRQT